MSATRAVPVRVLRKDPPARLTIASFLLSLTILLVIFACLNPIWRASEMGAWNENIWWSYAPIPVLAGLFLALERKFGWAPLFLESMKLTFVKFVITFLAANAIWSIWGTPGVGEYATAEPSTEVGADPFAPVNAPAATIFDPGQLGSIAGTLRDDQGDPIAGALVRISGGLEDYVFAPPTESVVLANRGSGFEPDCTVVHTYQTIELRSPDGTLHTAVMSDPKAQLMLNFPVLSSEGRTLMFRRPHGIVRITCSVHGGAESDSRILIVSNPFYAKTDSTGRFEFRGVPAGAVQLSFWSKRKAEHTELVEIGPGQELDLDLGMP